MFQQRLKIFLVGFTAALLILIARLAWLQLVEGEQYRLKFQQSLEQPLQWLQTVRGTLCDRQGRTLAMDRPQFELCLHYKLTRLYDDRFWRQLKAKYLYQASKTTNTQPADYRMGLLSPAEAADICGLALGQYKNEIQSTDPQQVEAFIQQRMDQAESLLADLAQTCHIPKAKLREAVEKINDDVYRWQVSRARREFYRNHPELTLDPDIRGSDAIFQNLVQAVGRVHGNDDPEVLVALTRIGEMEAFHPIVPIGEDEALVVEERFIGAWAGFPHQDRLISIRSGKTRVYPYNDAACHLIGQMAPAETVDPPAEVPPTDRQLLDYYPGDRRGEWGFEYMFEPLLRGRRGYFLAHRRNGVVDRVDPVPGQDITVSLDIELQRKIQGILLGANSIEKPYYGSAIVIDVPTGQVLAMASVPTFDLNSYYQADHYLIINRQDIREQYWCNRALMKNYMPGSTIKPTLLLGALENQIVTMDTLFTPEKTWPDGPYDIRQNYPMNAHEAIKESCLFYFVKLGERMGTELLPAWLARAGFGHSILAWPNLACPAATGMEGRISERAGVAFRETAGHTHPLDREKPTTAELRYMSIGRGVLDGSVLQIANSMATIARGGVFKSPTLTLHPAAEQTEERIVSSLQNVDLLHQAMKDVIYDPIGTGYKAFSPPGWPADLVTLYGKTGSTDHSLFGGFASDNKGRCLALAVVIEVDEYGSDVAAPIAKDIFHACAKFGYLPPVVE